MGSSVQPAPTSGLSYLYAPESPLVPVPPLIDPQNKGDGSNGTGGGGGGGGLAAPPSYHESFEHQTLQTSEFLTPEVL
jgi:hypothetical protein